MKINVDDVYVMEISVGSEVLIIPLKDVDKIYEEQDHKLVISYKL